ncbi:MAG: DNA replication/repair protein RecF [Erysipelotrichales bacterium]
MYLNSISLRNYRNLADLDLSFDNNVNIFIGNNGQGKTNLLEAIYFISLTKSFKTNKLQEIMNQNHDFFMLRASIYKQDYPYNIEINYNDNKKHIMINNNNESKFKDVLGLLNAVLFVPEDLYLIKGNPSLRRKLLDIELSKIYPKYLISLSAYYQILKQRNAYLKEDKLDPLVIDSFDDLLVNHGEIIKKYREEFIVELSNLTLEFYQLISASKDIISLEYQCTIKDEIGYYECLKKSIQRDCYLHQTNVGIHRDDFKFLLNGKDASSFASQGEQRTIVLAIKLGLVEYIYRHTKEYPILLLDDVMSELDEFRQENLIKYLNEKVQTFITTTSLSRLNESITNKAQLFNIDNGTIKEADVNGTI